MTDPVDSRFQDSLNVTLRFEGGWYPGNLPGDPNATMKGIIQTTYDGWRRSRALPVQSVRLISDQEVHDIYLSRFWNRAKCYNYPWPLCLLVFDWAVNSGPSHATTGLERVTEKVGTYNEVPTYWSAWLRWARQRRGEADLSQPQVFNVAYLKQRWAFLENLMEKRPTTRVFRRGWANRINALAAVSGLELSVS